MATRKAKPAATAGPALPSAEDVTYDPATHTSRLPDGQDVPHVTHVLSSVGVATDFEELSAMSETMRVSIDKAKDLGTVVHADTHAYDDDDLDMATVHPLSLPFLEAWATVRAHKDLKPYRRERRVFHALLVYTGIMDGLFTLPDGRIILVDIKTGDPESSGCRWQTAAYEKAYKHASPGAVVDERWAVRLCPRMRVPYRITNYTAEADSWRDGHTFEAFLTTYRHQAVRR